MAKFIVQKSGPLMGEVEISGSKNAVLPIMAATLLSEEPCVIMDVPKLRDVDVMCQILARLGSDVTDELGINKLTIATKEITATEPPYGLVSKMRASFVIMGPLLARTGRARIPYRRLFHSGSGRDHHSSRRRQHWTIRIPRGTAANNLNEGRRSHP